MKNKCSEIVCGALYLGSFQFVASPLTSISILLVGRIVLGVAEGFIIASALSWGDGSRRSRNGLAYK